jgi:transposase-like protein
MPSHWCTLLLLLTALLVGLVWNWRWRTLSVPPSAAVTAAVQRLLKPRTPDNCPICRQQAAVAPSPTPIHSTVTPWRQIKSRRGAPKHIATQGFACPNRTCLYYRITDAQIHALSGDGMDGRHERRETFRCQACGTTFSARRDTPLYRLKTSSQRVGEVLTALAEGLSISAAVRVFGHRHASITTWLTRAGERSAMLHDHFVRNLQLPHVQLDELRTRLRERAHALWLWVGVDPLTKIIPVLHHPEGTRRTDARRSPHGDPRLAPTAGPKLHSNLHQRRIESLLPRAHGPFWALGDRW